MHMRLQLQTSSLGIFKNEDRTSTHATEKHKREKHKKSGHFVDFLGFEGFEYEVFGLVSLFYFINVTLFSNITIITHCSNKYLQASMIVIFIGLLIMLIAVINAVLIRT